MERYYVVEGAKLQCTLGTSPGKLKVTSQQKLEIDGKLKATAKDKMLEPPFFGSCTCKSPNPPCSPAFQDWQVPGKKSSIGPDAFVMDDSRIQCSQGGIITVTDANQCLVSTGEEDVELDKTLPKFEGEIIFVNGYLSNPLKNSESHYNAIADKNPDHPDNGALKGENTDEHDRTHPDDLFTANEREERAHRGKWEKLWEDEVYTRLKQPITPFVRFSYTPEEKYWGYWNSKTNKMRGTEIYAEYFNALGNEHFINGSHGLGSNAAHRIDHGIAQGYTWAKENWNIETFDYIKEHKEQNPFIETFSPAYKPVTIVGHSQGAAMAAGVAIGVLKYAADMCYERIPLNLILLGVHQPKNLTGKEYDQLLRQKTKYLEVDGFYLKLLGENEKSGKEYLNGISDLFDPEHHKLKNERGIYEHLKAILGSWPDFKKRAVQFTFANDRGDLVLRDGDIPGIDSACHPKGDTTLYSVEFFSKRDKIPAAYECEQGKEIIDLSEEDERAEGFIVIPPYIANRRFDFDALEKLDNPTKDQKEHGVEWGDYRSVCIRWGIAMARYKRIRKEYDQLAEKHWYVPERDRANSFLYAPLSQFGYGWSDLAAGRWYAPLQTADLYAHFSPVGLIDHKKLLSDFANYSDDTVGTTGSIWERIKKVGEDRFYRVNFEQQNKEKINLDSKKNRKNAQTFVIEDGLQRMIPVSIGNTRYIKDVIAAFVERDSRAMERVYKEPIKMSSHVKTSTAERIQKIVNHKKMSPLKLKEIKQDNTLLKRPKDI